MSVLLERRHRPSHLAMFYSSQSFLGQSFLGSLLRPGKLRPGLLLLIFFCFFFFFHLVSSSFCSSSISFFLFFVPRHLSSTRGHFGSSRLKTTHKITHLLVSFVSSSAVSWDAEDGVQFQFQRCGFKWSAGPAQVGSVASSRRTANPSNYVRQGRPHSRAVGASRISVVRRLVHPLHRSSPVAHQRWSLPLQWPMSRGWRRRSQCAREGSSRSVASRKIQD